MIYSLDAAFDAAFDVYYGVEEVAVSTTEYSYKGYYFWISYWETGEYSFIGDTNVWVDTWCPPKHQGVMFTESSFCKEAAECAIEDYLDKNGEFYLG